jgi:lysophospholipase L1-like esterase
MNTCLRPATAPIDPATLSPRAYLSTLIHSSLRANSSGTVYATPGGDVLHWADVVSGYSNSVSQTIASLALNWQGDELVSVSGNRHLLRSTLNGGDLPQPYTALLVGRAALDNSCFASFGTAAQFIRSKKNTSVANAGANLSAGATPDMAQRHAYVIQFNGSNGRIYCDGRLIMKGNIGPYAAKLLRVGLTHSGGSPMRGGISLVGLYEDLWDDATMAGVQSWCELNLAVPSGLTNKNYLLEPLGDNDVLCVGDSITLGQGGITPFTGYRKALFERAWTLLGKRINFVGTLSSGPPFVAGEPFPPYHAGYGGYTTLTLLSKLMQELAKPKRPSVIVLMAGMNDARTQVIQGIPIDPWKNLGNLIHYVHVNAPEVQMLVTNVTPSTYPAYVPVIEDQWNPAAAAYAQLCQNADHRLEYLDVNAFFKANGGVTPDFVHPNQASHDNAIAPAIYDRLAPVLV